MVLSRLPGDDCTRESSARKADGFAPTYNIHPAQPGKSDRQSEIEAG
jgi:hypothetical protein